MFRPCTLALLACTSTVWAQAADPAAPPATHPAELPAPPDDADPATQLAAYKAALDNAARRIEGLERELRDARVRLDAAERALQASGAAVDPATLDLSPQGAARLEAERREREAQERVAEARRARNAGRDADRAEREQARAERPQWYYTWQLGYIDTGRRSTTYVKQTEEGQVVFIGDRASVDRRNITIRGTFENRSTRPYRYTFDVGVLEEDVSGRDLFRLRSDGYTSSTRYQTPVLEPGELHRWELTMSVNDSLDIVRAGIGNVRGDAPADGAAAGPTDAPAAGEAPREPAGASH